MVVDKVIAPMYDERFRGYGMNKASASNFFFVSPSRASLCHCLHALYRPVSPKCGSVNRESRTRFLDP